MTHPDVPDVPTAPGIPDTSDVPGIPDTRTTPGVLDALDNPGATDVPPVDQLRHRWVAMGAIALGVALVIMDATIVNVATPVVIEDLGLTATEAQWMNAVYSLVFAALMLTSGRLGDLYGRRRFFVAGILLFGASSLLAGGAPSALVLIGARAVQGIGAAMILPATLSTINAMFTGRDRGIAFAIYGAAIGGMAAVGPLVGGWLATDFSWRWAFWLNVPFVLATLPVAARLLPETRDVTLRRGIDVPGTVLASLGLAGIVFGLIESSTYGWLRQDDGSISPVFLALSTGILLLGLFVLLEQARERAGKTVLTHLGLFRYRTFRYGVIAAAIVCLGEFGMLFAIPLLLQGAMGYSALDTGWLMMALAAGTFLTSGATPHLAERLGVRGIVRIGLALEAAAVGALAIALPAGRLTLAALLFAYGLGVGLATAQLTRIVLTEIPVAYSGEASGLNTTFRQLGSALGIALLGGLLIGSLTTTTRDHLAQAGVPESVRPAVGEAVHGSIGAAIPQLAENPVTAPAAAVAADAMVVAAKQTTGVAAGMLALGLLATLALPADRPERAPGPTKDQTRSGTSSSSSSRRRPVAR